MRFGKIKNWLLIGGEDIILEAAIFLKEKNQDIMFVTGQRNLDYCLRNGITLKENLEIKNIDYYISDDINKDEFVLNYVCDSTLALSLGSPWIFKNYFIEKFGYRIINLHEANLPNNRGGGTLSWKVLMKTQKSASVLHIVTSKIDGGDVVLKFEYKFPISCKTPKQYTEIIYANSLLLISSFLSRCLNDEPFSITTQDNSKSTYWPRLNTETQGFINWAWDVNDIISFVRAFDEPYKGSRSYLNGDVVLIRDVKKSDDNISFHPFQFGLIYRKLNNTIFVSAKGGGLSISCITDLNGLDIYRKIKTGDRIFTPRKILERGLMQRPIYSSKGLEN